MTGQNYVIFLNYRHPKTKDTKLLLLTPRLFKVANCDLAIRHCKVFSIFSLNKCHFYQKNDFIRRNFIIFFIFLQISEFIFNNSNQRPTTEQYFYSHTQYRL